MPAPDSEAPSFDIGVSEATAQRRMQARPQGQASHKNRSLPRWIAVALAFVVGWLLGAVLTGGTETVRSPEADVHDERQVEPPPEAVGGEELVSRQNEEVAAASESVEESALDVTAVVLLLAPLRGVAIPADLQVINQGVTTEIALDRQVSGATPGVIGQADRRILTVGDQVVFMALDSVMVFDPELMSEPVEVAEAIYLLPGSDAGSVWAVGSGSQTVRAIDIVDGTLSELHDISAAGTPLASFSGGLVLAPTNSERDAVVLWNPRAGVQSLGLADDLDFIDAGGNTLVFEGPTGLVTYNTVTDTLTTTNRRIQSSERHRAIVSPDGQRLAIVQRGIITELPVVLVIDTGSGATVDQFEVAYEWQLQWVGARDLLFALPTREAVGLRLRDTAQQTSQLVVELTSPNYLITALVNQHLLD